MLAMLKSRTFSSNFSKVKLQFKERSLISLRWSTDVASENIQYYDEATLEAAKSFKELPCMRQLPLIGTGWIFLPIIGRYSLDQFNTAMIDKRKLFGNIFRDKLGPFNFVVSFNADDLKTMYEIEGHYPQRTELETIRKYRESRKNWYTTLGLTVLQGKEWHDLRKKTQKHLMKPKAIQAFLNPMQDVARDFINKIKIERDVNKEVSDTVKELSKWSLESVALVGLDVRLGCLQPNLHPDSDGMKMVNSVKTGFECILNLEPLFGNIPMWKYFPTPTWKRFVESADTFAEISYKYINRSLEKLKSSTGDEQDLTLLQSMLLTMDTSTAMVTVNDLMMAGIDTTSNTVGFFLYHIAKNPEKQEILYQLFKRVLPHKEDRITPSIFNELRYLKACIKESQRLHPIVGGHVRVVDHDVIFSGYRIPAKTGLLVVSQGIFRDERYFSDPNEFLPERWLNKDENFHPFAFLPFGFGTRSCIGRRLAELEMICVTTEILRNFRVEYHHEDIGMVTRLINVPDRPLKLKFIER